MPLKFVRIPATGCDVSESELNHFMGSHRVLAVEKRFVDVGENSFWAVCVDYLDGGSAGDKSSSRSQRNQIDYRRILSDEQFTVFAALRELRKELAAQDGVPLYTVFTNQQLAQIVQLKITDRANLKKVDGVGDGRVEKYGDAILQLINKQAVTDAANETPVSPDTGT
jgi:superfamily II DNA helicase RecQ